MIISMNVAGKNTYDDLGLIMTVEEMKPPAMKSYKVDVPGGNGSINLTKALNGDTVYENRSMTFLFTLANGGDDFEQKKTMISNMLHGQEFDFSLSFDPRYTYHGWFSVDAYERKGNLKQIKVVIDAEPYKSMGLKTDFFNVTGGIVAHLSSGRKMTKPTFEFSDDTIVVFEGARYVLPKGAHTINDVYFKQGVNEVTFVPAGITSHLTWGEASKYTWEGFKARPLYDWYKGITKYYVSEIVLTAVETAVTGVITFTATDANGSTFTQTLDLGDLSIQAVGEEADTITIFDGVAHVRKIIDTDGTVLPLPQSYTFDFPMLFSNDAEITSLAHDSLATVSYETADMNTEKVFREGMWSDYMDGGEYAMTWGEANDYTWAQLRNIDTGESRIYDVDTESVFVQYEWLDL